MQPLHRVLCIVWWTSIAGVVAGSLLPVDTGNQLVPNADKIEHLLGYTWLAVLPWGVFPTVRQACRASLAMFVLGAALELAQAFVPGRYASVADIIANGTGVMLGLGLGWYAVRRGWRYARAA